MSLGEIFAYVTGLEYAYDHAPQKMKVVVQAFGLLCGSIGSAVALAFTPIARDPDLVAFYALLAAGMTVVTIVFWVVFRKYDAEEVPVAGYNTNQRFTDPAPKLDSIDFPRPLSFPVLYL